MDRELWLNAQFSILSCICHISCTNPQKAAPQMQRLKGLTHSLLPSSPHSACKWQVTGELRSNMAPRGLCLKSGCAIESNTQCISCLSWCHQGHVFRLKLVLKVAWECHQCDSPLVTRWPLLYWDIILHDVLWEWEISVSQLNFLSQ